MDVVSFEEWQRNTEMTRRVGETVKSYADAAMAGIGFRPYKNQRFSEGDSAYIRNRSKDWEVIIFEGLAKFVQIRMQAKASGELSFERYVKGVPWLYRFESLDELDRACPRLVEAAVRYCPRVFELNAKRQPQPDLTEVSKELFDDRQILAEGFKAAYGFPDDPLFGDLKRLERMLADRADDSFEDVRSLVLGAAAYFGDSVVRRFGGEWILEQKGNRVCYIGFGGCKEAEKTGRVCDALVAIVAAWRSQCMDISDLNWWFLDAGKESETVDERFLQVGYWQAR